MGFLSAAQIKRLILGETHSDPAAHHERIPKWRALAVLSSDALSSVAYATEEMLIPLAAFSIAATAWTLPVAFAIVGLLIIVTASYRQTIDAYPNGGGAYIVAKENLGVNAGLVAGASLLIDYALTVAVSVAAGVENLASAWPFLANHREGTAAVIILSMGLLNRRGIRETSNLFAIPTYFFIFSVITMIVIGFLKIISGEAILVEPIIPETYTVIPMILVLRAFASGCAALTGVEAISDGVSTFLPPAQRNAKITLMWMAGILGAMFIGLTALAHVYGISHQHGETLISSLARTVYGNGLAYYGVQIATAAILFLAANTAYSDFPRVCSFLAKDRYLPRQLASVGDRLAFSNGILGLNILAVVLIFIFNGHTHQLIPLYAVGVFLSFTLSQLGMVRYHLKNRARGFQGAMLFNGVGALTTATVLGVVIWTKFLGGAWMVIALLPLLVIFFKKIHHHYISVGEELSLESVKEIPKLQKIRHTVIVPISGIHRGVIDALRYAVSISKDVRACYVEINPATTERVKAEWQEWAPQIPFVVLKSPYRSVIAPLLEYVDDVEKTTQDELITVVIPEFVTAKWWHQVLHNQTAFMIRAALMFKRRKVVTSVRYHLRDT